MTYPNIYPTGVTIYDPEKAWSGYTIFQANEVGALLIDMNGAEVQLWQGLHGFPNKLLPGGYILGHSGERNPAYGIQDQVDLVQVDWDGNIVWKFDSYEYIEDPGEQPRWMARQHHDYQREGNGVGYYVPGSDPLVDRGNTLILGHKNLTNPKISEQRLLDDTIFEITWDGKVVWEWVCSEHFDEYGFSEAAKKTLRSNPNTRQAKGSVLEKIFKSDAGDWMHINSMSVLGPNKWFDGGDRRFHPDNIIWDARETNIIAIIDKKTGGIAWKIGPDYDTGKEADELGWIIGQHHAHMIPRGLPGEGNILVFDNGGWAGYGEPNPSAPTGAKNVLRDHSRVLEFDPITLKIVWQYTPAEAGFVIPLDANRFYSPFISSAQRLPNGNTLITEGSGGRIFEVTREHELVWEYISPYWGERLNLNMIYRAYRVPYEWVPQLAHPNEVPIERIDVKKFRVPGAAPIGRLRETRVDGVLAYQEDQALCVLTDEEAKLQNA